MTEILELRNFGESSIFFYAYRFSPGPMSSTYGTHRTLPAGTPNHLYSRRWLSHDSIPSLLVLREEFLLSPRNLPRNTFLVGVLWGAGTISSFRLDASSVRGCSTEGTRESRSGTSWPKATRTIISAFRPLDQITVEVCGGSLAVAHRAESWCPSSIYFVPTTQT